MVSDKQQVEEMARTIFESGVAIDGIDLAFAAVHGADKEDTHFMRIANHLYRNGYRKASDVAEEIFGEILKIKGLELHDWEAIAEIRRKYTEEGK